MWGWSRAISRPPSLPSSGTKTPAAPKTPSARSARWDEPAPFMTLRSDHIAGAAFVLFAIVVFALSGDLPFGSLSSPGAGMMPKLLLVLMIVFGIALIVGAAASQPVAAID